MKKYYCEIRGGDIFRYNGEFDASSFILAVLTTQAILEGLAKTTIEQLKIKLVEEI